jgi:hypothetical protein
MKTYSILLPLIVFLATLSCKQESRPDTLATANNVKQWQPTDTRSIFGNRAKRGLLLKTDKAAPGYVLFNPSNSTLSYLMDKDGSIVHQWKGELHTILSSYLLENGNLLRLERDVDFPTFAAGGQGGRIREYDWDGNLIWDFEYANAKELIHHDIEPLPNGNVLAISYEVKSPEEALAAGMKPENIARAGVWPDKIIEIKPIRPFGGELVWEWHLWDHLVQDLDPARANFGIIKQYPRKLNINIQGEQETLPMTQEQVDGAKKAGLLTANATADNQASDITHSNAISYNAALDQIALSIKRFGEIIIIDHATTTQEAKGSSGGRWGHGGDLLYRWGNPANYGRGTGADRILYEQHDVKWIPTGYPGEGQLLVFNNDVLVPDNKFPTMFAAVMAAGSPDPELPLSDIANYSEVLEILPPQNQDGSYILDPEGPFGPKEVVWRYRAPDKYSFYSAFISGAHRLKNGHTLITAGAQGRFFEVSPENEIVWEYWNPYNFNYVLPDGSPAHPGKMVYTQFRSTPIEKDFPAFAGKELRPIVPQPKPFIFKMPPPPAADSGSK